MIASSLEGLKQLDNAAADTPSVARPPFYSSLLSSASFSMSIGSAGVQRWRPIRASEIHDVSGDDSMQAVIKAAERDVSRFPSRAKAHANLGQALLNADKLDFAEAAFSRALALDPKDYLALRGLARIALGQRKLDKACDLYKAILKENPRDTTALVSLSQILIERGEYEDAAGVLARHLQLDPDAGIVRFHLAISLLNLNRNREALKHLKIAVRSDVRNPALYHALGLAYASEEDYTRAVKAFQAALTLSPGDSESTKALGKVLLSLGRYPEAIQLLTAFLRDSDASDLDARELLGQAYRNSGEIRYARMEWTEMFARVQDRAEQARLLNNIGMCLAMEGNRKDATKLLLASIDLVPNEKPTPYLNLARVHFKAGEFRAAVAVLSEVVRKFPAEERAPQFLAVTLERLGKFAEAAELLRAQLAAGRIAENLFADLGWILSDGIQDYAAALEVLKDGWRRYPRCPSIVNNLAYAHLMLGQPSEARRVLETLPLGESDFLALPATWGLLSLWENNLERGRQLYEKAAESARKREDSRLMRAILQKMNLELARALSRLGDNQKAMRYVEAGLAVKGGRDVFLRDLRALQTQLS